MAGKATLYTQPPFFWTNQFINASFTGYSGGADWTYTETKADEGPLKTARITYFFKNGRCIGAAQTNWFGAIIKLRLALERGLMPSREELENKTANYETIAARVKQSNPCGSNKCCS